jgi:hypothetical protein
MRHPMQASRAAYRPAKTVDLAAVMREARQRLAESERQAVRRSLQEWRDRQPTPTTPDERRRERELITAQVLGWVQATLESASTSDADARVQVAAALSVIDEFLR